MKKEDDKPRSLKTGPQENSCGPSCIKIHFCLSDFLRPRSVKGNHRTAGRAIAFGDNYNNMGMFRCADECYAVENSVPGLKQMADGIIPCNEEEGVAQKLREFLTKDTL